MITCYFVRCAMCKGSVYCKNITDKLPEDRAAWLIPRLDNYIINVGKVILFCDCVIPS